MTTEIALIELVTAQKGAAGGEDGLQRKQEEQVGQQPGTGLTKGTHGNRLSCRQI